MLRTVYVLRSTWWYNHEIAKCQKTEIIYGVMLYSGPCIINVPVQCQVQSTQSNCVNTDTKGTIDSVLINGVSVSSGLDLEKI